jgi:RNA polymerase sigma-70 factor, ECF subfamily
VEPNVRNRRRNADRVTAEPPAGTAPSDRESGLNAVSGWKVGRPDITQEHLGAATTANGATWTQKQRESFHALYREHFDFVYRNLRRLGVPDALVDDALQDVYLVVLRQVDRYREGTHPRAWLFAIAMRVAGNYRRAIRRRGVPATFNDDQADSTRADAFDLTARAQAGRILQSFLDRLDDERRAVFVLSELEQMTAPEIARALSANVNTVYSRLRAARSDLERMLAGLRRSQGGEHE